MEGHRQRAGGGGRRRRRKNRNTARAAAPEPVMIAARRPNSPLLSRPTGRTVAASAAPKVEAAAKPPEPEEEGENKRRRLAGKDRSAARIVQVSRGEIDANELERQRLHDRLLLCEGRGAISKVANLYLEGGFEFPSDQETQIQLLEHVDEARARDAIRCISRLLERDEPIKKPILLQRLRRLEEYADEAETREAAAELLRVVR